MRGWLKVVGALAGLVVLAEVGAGYLNFQRGSERGLGLAWLADRVQARMQSPTETHGISMHGVYQPENGALRKVLMESYAAEFDAFVKTARERSCALALLYIPTDPTYPAARNFFAGLAERGSVPFIDMQPVKERFDAEQLYLTPGDTHPSRLLAHLTARAVGDRVEGGLAGDCPGQDGDALVGPWVSDLSEIRETAKGLAFRFHSDARGFRSAGPRAAGAGKSVLIIGDSFSFGTSLADQDTWPAFLQRRLPQALVSNAGVGGISIVRQREILEVATKAARADLIILQVNETDLQGLTPAYWPEMKRKPELADQIGRFF